MIVGRLIPAGTGFGEYRDTFVVRSPEEATGILAAETAVTDQEESASPHLIEEQS